MKRIMNAVRFLLVFALNFYIMAVFHSYISFLFMAGMILFPIYSAAGAHYIVKHASFEIIPPMESMYRGESAVLHFKLANPSFFVLVNAVVQIELSNTFYGENRLFFIDLPVKAKGTSTADWELELEACGHITARAVTLRVMDLLGVYEKQRDIDVRADFLVLPRGDDSESGTGRMFRQGASEAVENRNKGDDFSEIGGIRAYIPGDKLQNIHWKLSAKQKELMVKERLSMSDVQLNVLLDLADREDRRLEFVPEREDREARRLEFVPEREDREDRRLESVLELADGLTRGFVLQSLPFTVYYYSVNLGKLRSLSVGSERERVQWLEQVLYDRHYDSSVSVEELFREAHPGVSYLYIGMERGGEEPGRNGRPRAMAELRE